MVEKFGKKGIWQVLKEQISLSDDVINPFNITRTVSEELHATIDIQPHIKGSMTPQKLLPFHWEKKGKKGNDAPQLSKNEAKKRFEEMVKRIVPPMGKEIGT